MLDRTYIIGRTLEDKIAIAENIGQNTMIVTLDVLKEILALLKEQEREIAFLKTMQLQTVNNMNESELGRIVGETLGFRIKRRGIRDERPI